MNIQKVNPKATYLTLWSL